MKIIDVSTWQPADIDWATVKASGVEGVIARSSYGLKPDQKFAGHMAGALSVGLSVGAYHLMMCLDAQGAAAEANLAVGLCSPYRLTWPLYADIEDVDTMATDINAEVMAFGQVVSAAGLKPGVYANLGDMRQFDWDAIKDFSVWLAQYNDYCSFEHHVDLWQYQEAPANTVPGISSKIDLNEGYTDYRTPPEIKPIGGQPMKEPLNIIYSGHSQNLGWGPDYRSGQTAGTVHQCLRLEAVKAAVEALGKDIHLMGRAHVQNLAWMPPGYDGAVIGTEGQGLEIEALQFELSGADAVGYSVWYQVQAQNLGWLGWVRDGALTGTVGKALQLEALRMLILDSSVDLSAATAETYQEYIAPPAPIPEPAPIPIQGGDVDMITAHFARSEYACDCGGRYCDGFPVPISQDVANGVEQIRQILGAPVHVSSGVRCEQRNAEVGGVPYSKHKLGHAADIWTDGMDAARVSDIATIARSLGMGAIEYPYELFCHVEI